MFVHYKVTVFGSMDI